MHENSKKIIKAPSLQGAVGESAVWDGPLDTTGFLWEKVVVQVQTVCKLKNTLASLMT